MRAEGHRSGRESAISVRAVVADGITQGVVAFGNTEKALSANAKDIEAVFSQAGEESKVDAGTARASRNGFYAAGVPDRGSRHWPCLSGMDGALASDQDGVA